MSSAYKMHESPTHIVMVEHSPHIRQDYSGRVYRVGNGQEYYISYIISYVLLDYIKYSFKLQYDIILLNSDQN